MPKVARSGKARLLGRIQCRRSFRRARAVRILAVMQRSRFCLSPEGYGYWTHRTAEALCCGAIPILQHPER
ncbi:MAG: exostosin family protein [Verrucomicrobiales bacterium]